MFVVGVLTLIKIYLRYSCAPVSFEFQNYKLVEHFIRNFFKTYIHQLKGEKFGVLYWPSEIYLDLDP